MFGRNLGMPGLWHTLCRTLGAGLVRAGPSFGVHSPLGTRSLEAPAVVVVVVTLDLSVASLPGFVVISFVFRPFWPAT
jgi:hypothetical protein